MKETVNWSKYPAEAEKAWTEFNRTGNREAVHKVFMDAIKRIKNPRLLIMVYFFALNFAYDDERKKPRRK